jgi:predicted ABC-type ATPase
MRSVAAAAHSVLKVQHQATKPLAVIVAGHNGSGKSTMWYQHLSSHFMIPFVNADRMMLSILPEPDKNNRLMPWAQELRDTNQNWMRVAQKGVESFVAQAMANKVPFAMETVFSYWEELADGTVKSKVDLIKQMQDAGYFVLLFFVGLGSKELSIARVNTRTQMGGHDVETRRLIDRFPRTQKAISTASRLADATIMVDNSLTPSKAFTVCLVRLRKKIIYDCRADVKSTAAPILQWMSKVCPES